MDNLQTTDEFIPASKVPKLDKFVHLKTYTFQLRKAKTQVKVDDVKLNDASMTLKAHVTDELGKGKIWKGIFFNQWKSSFKQ